MGPLKLHQLLAHRRHFTPSRRHSPPSPPPSLSISLAVSVARPGVSSPSSVVAFSAPSVEARLPAIAAFSPARVSTPPCEPPRSPSSSPTPFSSESPHVAAPPPVTVATFSLPPALSVASPPPATAATSSSLSTPAPFSTPLGDPASPSGISRAPPYPAATRVGTPSGEFHLRPQHRATRRRRAFVLLAIPLLAVGLLPHAWLQPRPSPPTIAPAAVWESPQSIAHKRRTQPLDPMATHAWFPFVPMPPQAPPSEQEEDSPLDNSGSMKDEMIHLYLNNSTMALAIPREACLLGAPRCHGIGMLVGAFSICKEQEQVREAILEERLMLTAFLLTYSEPHAGEGVLGVQEDDGGGKDTEGGGDANGTGGGEGGANGRRRRRQGKRTGTEGAEKAARVGEADGD
ncbi:hypothetical protein OsI_37463 [Oryza sativa Indica Group]|uniref:Uncharacterized protein n=1 Tax=Oryza sativa subsp. indica TaxID=39946 RepID=B8BM20_ORYSI|nr:hypothetical protein OsI_37463 [Oryza sativa Indica Group]